jgi:RNA-directed DNA polymerase
VAYQEAKANDGSPGIDGESFQSIEIRGVEKFLDEIRQELLAGTYEPSKNPAGRDTQREWQDPKVRDSHHQGSSCSGSCKADPGADL